MKDYILNKVVLKTGDSLEKPQYPTMLGNESLLWYHLAEPQFEHFDGPVKHPEEF